MSEAAHRARPARRIALLKPPADVGEAAGHALQLFDSMLWVFRGTTQSNWNLCSAAEAEVIVLHRSEAEATIDEWRHQGKVIVILSTDTAASAPGDHMLTYPFPSATVLSLLDRLDLQLGSSAANASSVQVSANSKQAAGSAHELVELVRTVRGARNPGLWLAVSDGGQPLLWLRGDGAAYRTSPALRSSIRCGALQLHTLHTQQVPSPPGELVNISGEEIVWFGAYHSVGSSALWFDETAQYRLRRWPDFGALRAPDALTMACQLRVVAALDAQPATLGKLVVRARVTRLQTTRTLNALAACGFIEVSQAAAAQRTEFVVARPESGFKQLLRGLRKRLQSLGAA